MRSIEAKFKGVSKLDYYELLRSYIAKSGKSLSKISEELIAEGISVSKGYISQLQNAKTGNPATEAMNRALAKVTGGDLEKLLFAATLEKAPPEIKEKMDKLIHMRELQAEYNTSTSDFIKINIINPLDTDAHSFEYVHKSVVNMQELFAFKIINDLMIGDFITTNDIAICIRTNEVENDDLVLISIKNRNDVLCRIKCLGEICVISYSNSKIQPEIINSSEVSIIGKIIELRRKY